MKDATSSRRSVSSLLLVLLPFWVACGRSEVPPPSVPVVPVVPAGSTLPKGACVDAPAKVSVLEMTVEEAGAIEVAMHEGIAVVASDCAGLKLLPKCTARGSYTFVGHAPKREAVHATPAPGETRDLTLVTVGDKVASASRVSARELEGACIGASHVVRGASVGAYRLDTGAMFGGQQRHKTQANGDPSSCSSAPPNKTAGECGGLIVVDLAPIER